MNHHDIPFSLELEAVNTSQKDVARVLQRIIAGSLQHQLTEHWPNIWNTEKSRRIWQISKGKQTGLVKIVTPPFTLADLEMLKWLVQSLGSVGAQFDKTTQMIVSIDKRVFDVRSLSHLIQIFYRKQNAIYSFCRLPDQIIEKYCRKLPVSLMTSLALLKPKTLDDLRFAWYSSFLPRSIINQEHESGCYGLNLHTFFWENEVKFQHFLATPALTRLENNIRLALMITTAALCSDPKIQTK